MNDSIELVAHAMHPPQLMLLLHGVGATPRNLLPLAEALRARFPDANLLLMEGFEAFDGGPFGRQWFSIRGISESNRAGRIAGAVPALIDHVRAQQQRFQASAEATALVGFSQGAILALAAAAAHDGLVGRVLAFAGRYAPLPERAARRTTIHLLHGEDDPVVDVEHARQAIERHNRLHSDATADIATGVGHELHPVLIERALTRLATHIPHRVWAQAVNAGYDDAASSG